MVVILLSRHGVVRKTLLHCVCFLMDQLGKSRAEKHAQAPMVEACGLAQTAEGGEYYVEASRATNNTAEMQAPVRSDRGASVRNGNALRAQGIRL